MTVVEIAKEITNYGLLVIISALAIWFVIYNYLQQGKRELKEEEKAKCREAEQKARDEKFNESLQMLSKAIDNQTRTLELLKSSIDGNEILLKQHDEKMTLIFEKHDARAVAIKEDIIELKAKRRSKND
jgi:uncharacterized protein HemX